jgi:hypothetical protein
MGHQYRVQELPDCRVMTRPQTGHFGTAASRALLVNQITVQNDSPLFPLPTQRRTCGILKKANELLCDVSSVLTVPIIISPQECSDSLNIVSKGLWKELDGRRKMRRPPQSL